MSNINGFLKVLSPLGMPIDVAIASEDDALAFMRDHADAGWSPAHIPDGGFTFPYDAAGNFDFRLIGAREFSFDTTEDGETKTMHCLEHRGLTYTCRELEKGARRGRDKIKYSRGATVTDPVHLREGASGENKGFITLISFVGKGRIDRRYLKSPAKPAARRAAQTTDAKPPAPANGARDEATQPAPAAAQPADAPAPAARPLAAVPVAVNLVERWAKLGRDRNEIRAWLKTIGINDTNALTDAQKTTIHEALLGLERAAAPTIGMRWEALGRDKAALPAWLRSLNVRPTARGGEYSEEDKAVILAAIATLEAEAAERAEYERAAQ